MLFTDVQRLGSPGPRRRPLRRAALPPPPAPPDGMRPGKDDKGTRKGKRGRRGRYKGGMEAPADGLLRSLFSCRLHTSINNSSTSFLHHQRQIGCAWRPRRTLLRSSCAAASAARRLRASFCSACSRSSATDVLASASAAASALASRHRSAAASAEAVAADASARDRRRAVSVRLSSAT